ncbi:MAG: LysR family transcriptional regulator [Pseudomonadota bacterium]
MTRNLDVSALRSLVAVADTEGVTRAAAQVSLTQSAVSMQIKRLEETFGTRLLHREGRGVKLTQTGEQLVGYARRLIALNDETWLRLTNEEFEGELRLGVAADIVYPYIPRILQRCRDEFPRVRTTLSTCLTKVLREKLRNGEIDIIITTEKRPGKGGEALASVRNEWYGAVGGKAHLCRPLPVVMCRNCAQKGDVLKTLDNADIAWIMAGDTDSETTASAMVSADLAVTPALGLSNGHNHEKVPAGALPELNPVSINLYTAAARKSAVMDAVADIVRQTYRARPPRLRTA